MHLFARFDYQFQGMIFKISLDKLAKVVTIAITLLFVSIIIAQLFLFLDSDKSASIISVFIILFIYLIVFSYRPICYKITDDLLVICRPLNDVKIALKEIKNVEILDQSRLIGTIRIFGVGGLFGYWGKFTNRNIGVMTWYATRRDQAILITSTSNKNILLTPDEPELFIQIIGSKKTVS